ncbi:proteasome endopeptidase complex, archaeal, beta subunit [Candidatus Micrarchaeota archaeon RBG_16_49_10]|nr:MAG: proteasome endopeptidase complex, archaeal, beta subunit [Candidatus Micrarchaeota archaeon RBG_16_49_10]
MKSGTTTVGIVCKDGIILAAERKATMGYMVASKDDLKITKIADHIGITQAGMVGDLQALARYLKAETKLFEIKNKKRITVRSTASLLSNILYGGRWSYLPYMIQIILAGYDESGPNLFILHPDGSSLEEKKFFSTGSGSPMAFGVLETIYKDGMSLDEGKRVAAKSIKAAVERDIASGGIGFDIAIIDKGGFRLLEEDEKKGLLV